MTISNPPLRVYVVATITAFSFVSVSGLENSLFKFNLLILMGLTVSVLSFLNLHFKSKRVKKQYAHLLIRPINTALIFIAVYVVFYLVVMILFSSDFYSIEELNHVTS